MSLIVLAVTAMASLPANAQDVLGASISGYTIDPAGTRMARAEVTAKSAESRLTSRALTDDSGFYALRGLPPGRYEVVATSGGTTSTSREIEVRTDISLRADFVVGISKLSEAVFVTAEPPLIEWSRATHVINVSGAVQRELPGSSLRGWSDFLLNVPGIVVTQTRLQTYALYGTAPGSGAVQVDGADATSVIQGSTLFSQFADDTFEDIAVVTGGKDMSAPLGLGALSRITTRAGSDMPHASVSVAAQPLTWNGANTPNGEDLTVETKQVDGSVGGPVARGKTWFFASVRVARNGTGVPRSLQQLQSLRLLSPEFRPFLNGYRGQGMFLKVTARGESRHALTASVANGSTRYGGAQPNEAGIFRDIVIGGPSAFARVTSTWGSRMLTTVSLDYNGKSQHTRNRSRETTGVNIHQSTFASGGRLIGTGALAVLEASPFAGTDFRMHMWTVSADALYFTSGRMGEHEISLGTQSQPRRRDRRVTEYNNGGFQLEERVLREQGSFSSAVAFHRQVFDRSDAVSTFVDTSDVALYVQDSWRPAPGLTLTAGIRADSIRRRDRLFGVVTQDSADISRRGAITWALDAAAHRVVYGSWARAIDNLSVNQLQAGTNISGVVDSFDIDLDGMFETTFVTPTRLARSSNIVLDTEHLHQPFVDEILGGIRQQLKVWLLLDVGVIRRKYGRPNAVETNAIYVGDAFTGYRDESQNEIFQITQNVWNWPVVTALDVAASVRHRRVDATFSWSRQFNRLSGTWQPNDPAARLQPEAFPNRGGIGSVSGCTVGGASCPDSDGYSAVSSSGGWRASVLHGAVAYRAPWGLGITMTTTMQSGPRSGPVLTRLAAGDPRFGPPVVTLSNGRQVSNPLATPVRFAYGTRAQGQLELPALILLNVRVSHEMGIKRGRLQTAIDVLNVTNGATDQVFQPGAQQIAGPFFGQSGLRQFPRSVLFSSRLSF